MRAVIATTALGMLTFASAGVLADDEPDCSNFPELQLEEQKRCGLHAYAEFIGMDLDTVQVDDDRFVYRSGDHLVVVYFGDPTWHQSAESYQRSLTSGSDRHVVYATESTPDVLCETALAQLRFLVERAPSLLSWITGPDATLAGQPTIDRCDVESRDAGGFDVTIDWSWATESEDGEIGLAGATRSCRVGDVDYLDTTYHVLERCSDSQREEDSSD